MQLMGLLLCGHVLSEGYTICCGSGRFFVFVSKERQMRLVAISDLLCHHWMWNTYLVC